MLLKTSLILRITASVLVIVGTQLPTRAERESKEWFVYIGTYTGEASRGVYLARFNSDTGTLSKPELAAEMVHPSFLAAHPSKDVLYAVSEDWSSESPEGTVHAFTIDRRTGKLSALGQQGSAGKGPCHLAVDAKGRTVLVANYGSGSIAALPLDRNGALVAGRSVVQHRGSSVNLRRQTGPHAHHIIPDARNRRVLVCDLGLDKILVYELASKNPHLRPNMPYGISVKPGAGPRHLAFHPSGKVLYVLNELSCTIDVLSYDQKRGSLSPLQTISTLPGEFEEENTCAEIQVHPSGHYVYASNRGHNSIAVFRTGLGGANLALVEHEPSGGKTPRHVAIDPRGKWLLAQNQDSNTIAVFRIELETGELRPTGQQQTVGKPVCLVFVRAR